MRSQHSLTAYLSSGSVHCPFLYQTRTILCQRRKLHEEPTKTLAGQLSKQTRSVNQSAGDNSSQGTQSASFLKQKAAKVNASKTKSASTITAAEKAAFDSIWALFETPSPSNSQIRPTSTDHTDTDYKSILGLFSTPPEETSEPGSITNHEVPKGPEHPRLLFSPEPIEEVEVTPSESNVFENVQTSESQLNLNRAGAMAEIQGFLKDTEFSSELPSDSAARLAPDTQTTALGIVGDIADSLTAALSSRNPRPDVAMWEVAGEKIFPLIKLLRPSTPSLSSPSPLRPDSASDSQSKAEPDPHVPQSHPRIPPDTPLLPLLSLAYPSLTLLILRLYMAHIPTSPYALALLPTLKSLGPTSYVLGAHTHFYNTLLSLYWTVYSDLRNISTLLAEMEANGVEFDLGTWEVIQAIETDRTLDLEGRGQRGDLWWGRTEQRVWWQRVGIEWEGIVRRTLENKGLSTGEFMREGYARYGKNSDHHHGDYVVTL